MIRFIPYVKMNGMPWTGTGLLMWYMLLVMSVCFGVAGGIAISEVDDTSGTVTKTGILGALFAGAFYYFLTWLFMGESITEVYSVLNKPLI